MPKRTERGSVKPTHAGKGGKGSSARLAAEARCGPGTDGEESGPELKPKQSEEC